ncbi:GGDEF domain-containing protein [Neiella marina]|uniref:diguanylate cyclase n=1 Tax=Neiella holothuriorum TaxID=2870530 RepID=A0ABS7EHT5_9GAMM|nr:GGDEF domain-containing protein [Neiella holothuriorum]MBW8191850.1 GGDEF domain-containing protein [Neiella holothuriorum]
MKDLNKAYKELESKFLNHREVLSRLIERMSHTCKGQLPELDNKLAKLRTSLKENVDLDNIKPLTSQVDTLLQQVTARTEADLTAAKQSFFDSCSTLQRARGLEPETRRQLRTVIEQSQLPENTLTHLLPHLTTLADLYSQTLKHLQQQKGIEPETLSSNIHNLSNSLMNMLSEFDFDSDAANAIKQQRAALGNASDAEQLVTICIDSMKIIVEAVRSERNGSEKFLKLLNNSLDRINQALEHSVSTSDKLNRIQLETEQKIREQLSELSKDVDSSDKLEPLKVQIASRLESINQLLAKRSSDSDLEHQLQQSLQQMSSRLSELESESKDYQTRLEEQRHKLYVDSLTGLKNRAAFDERFEIEFERAQRYEVPLTIAVMDLDHFKSINDNHGHVAGDKTLSAVGKLLKQWLRTTDFVARYGGEEFVVLLPQQTQTSSLPVLQKLCNKIASIPFIYKGQKLNVTMSIGVAQMAAPESRIALFDRADNALYQAKSQGRNQVVTAE